MEKEKLKKIIEGALFASGQALNIEKLSALFLEEERPDADVIKSVLDELQEDYAEKGVILKEVASGFRFQVCEETGEWVSRLWEEKPARYSRALLETLALVGYRQPVTRGEIEEIRGVSTSSQIMKTLLERDWVRIVGHRDVPGRPAMYATTRTFLDYFNLKNLDELPSLSEIRDLDQINAELDLVHPDLVMKLPVELPVDEPESTEAVEVAISESSSERELETSAEETGTAVASSIAQNGESPRLESVEVDEVQAESQQDDLPEQIGSDISDEQESDVKEPSYIPPVALPAANRAPLNDEAFDKPVPSLSPFSASIEALRRSDAERRASSSDLKKIEKPHLSVEQEDDESSAPDLSEQSAEALVIDEYIERQIDETGSVNRTIELDDSDLEAVEKAKLEERDL